MGAQFAEELSSRVVAKGERSLDLLSSTVVCTIWQFYFTHARPCIGMFLGIVRSLIVYLRLDRPIDVVLARPKLPKFPDLSEMSGERTDEERRIMVTCFASFAMISMSLKYDPIRWSPQHEESCQKLSQNLHIFGDQVLVAITRISKVSIEAASMIQRLSEDPEYAAHALLHVKTLRLMLDQTKSSLTPEQLHHTLVQSFLHATYVHIYEAALLHPPTSPMSQPVLDLQRTEYLTACMYATKKALDNYVSTSMIHMNMHSILSFSHAAQTLYKLSVLDYPGWDRTMVRATIDVMWYFEQAACKMEEASEMLKPECGDGVENIYSHAGPAWRSTAAIWREGLESAMAIPEPEVGPIGEDSGAIGFPTMDTSWLSIPDDIWFSNFFAR
ncbi:hypothetical protein K458DRAFT_289235 [Lentithecium fluviatile CBS 122367]|uniref:Transcription factor domain-containing protein n=1 Tax=Lentithecium fluviatile CBS 122367 TaxID=1168545 RepID=A0A6G1JIY3_9PLEO|nr:hypothetical protein K458DRAFT_289235 [Lentithecium fluviatile CBS 122367]